MICLKCGWAIIIGPGGCACTQAARRKRKMEEASKMGERLEKLLTPKQKREIKKLMKSMNVISSEKSAT